MEKWNEIIKNQAWVQEHHSNKEEEPRTILLMAGVHPEEEAGVFCLQELMKDAKWQQQYKHIRIVMVPCRNTFGFEIRTYLKQENLSNAKIILDNLHCKIIEMLGNYIVVLKKSMLLEKNRTLFWDTLKQDLSSVIKEGFIHLLSFRKNQDLRANTYFFKNGKLTDINALGEYPKTDFICDVKFLIEQYKPDLVIDLHEGKGTETYLYVDSKDEEIVFWGKSIIKSLEERCVPVREYASDRVKVSDGIFALEQLKSGRTLLEIAKFGKVMVVETGIENTLKNRIEILKMIIEKSIVYEWGENNGKACNGAFDENL